MIGINKQKEKNRRINVLNQKFEDKSGFRKALKLYFIGVSLFFLCVGIILTEFFERIVFAFSEGPGVLTRLDYFLFVAFLLLSILLIILGIIISNRIFGPIYRLVKHMQKSSETGVIEMLTFREDDYLQEIVISYNQMVTMIQNLNIKNNTEVL